MKIAWMADIHLEWLNQKSRKAFFEAIADEHPDVVLIGGDICKHDYLEPWLVKLQKKVQAPIYFCLGNHDYYHGSIFEVRELARSIARTHDQISWLPAVDVVRLTDEVGLVGHDCWGDGRVGSFFNSPLSLNDFKLIKELTGLSKHDQLEKVRQLGSEAAAYLASRVETAAQCFGKVVVLTHVPPFPESCLYMGKPSEEGLPFFCCKAAGDALKTVAANHPGTQFLVLSGHTHDAADVQISDNLHCNVSDAEYRRPNFRILELRDVFSDMNHDKWFRHVVEKALDEADDPEAVFIAHDEVAIHHEKKREVLRQKLLDGEASGTANDLSIGKINQELDRIDLMTIQSFEEIAKGLDSPIDDFLEQLKDDHCKSKVESVQQGLFELRSGQGELVEDDDTFLEDLRSDLKTLGGDENDESDVEDS